MAYRLGGYARGYQALFVPLAALSSPGYSPMDGQPAVCLCIAAFGVNVRFCRRQRGLGLDSRRAMFARVRIESLKFVRIDGAQHPRREHTLKQAADQRRPRRMPN